MTSTVPLSGSYTLYSAQRNEPNKHKYFLILLIDSAPGVTDKQSPIYIQDATLHSLLHLKTATCFGCYFHPSSEAKTTVSTASGIYHTVTATCRYRGAVGIAVPTAPR
jgi:hypothetical protein